jgi:hypothetical protein
MERFRVELVDRREPDVLIYIGGESGSGGYINVLAVFNEADGTEQDGKCHGCSGFAVSLSPFGAPNPYAVAPGH